MSFQTPSIVVAAEHLCSALTNIASSPEPALDMGVLIRMRKTPSEALTQTIAIGWTQSMAILDFPGTNMVD